MIFFFFMSIVFIAELIIAVFLLAVLYKFDKKIIEFNSLLNELKPSIKEILNTYEDLSKELLNFVPVVVKNIKDIAKNIVIEQLKSIVGALTFWLVKKEVEKHV